jgi:hypothetical protein
MSDWTLERDAALVERLGRCLVNAPEPAPGQPFLGSFDIHEVQALRAAWLEARAEVTRLRAVLDKPTQDEAIRLMDLFYETGRTGVEGIRAILADLRQRATCGTGGHVDG